MKPYTAAAAISVGLGLLGQPLLAAAPTVDTPMPTTQKEPQRFEFYARQGVPAEYRGKTNPNTELTVPIVIRGADIYTARCASCHGPMGFGNGVAAGRLRTQPADLAWSLSNPKVRDDYLYWTISEGGAQFGSAMPAYKNDLRADQIWELITYMHAAFEGREASIPRGTRQALLSETPQD